MKLSAQLSAYVVPEQNSHFTFFLLGDKNNLLSGTKYETMVFPSISKSRYVFTLLNDREALSN